MNSQKTSKESTKLSTGLFALDEEFLKEDQGFLKVDLVKTRVQMREILSLSIEEEFPATPAQVIQFGAIHQLMTRKACTPQWARKLQVRLPASELKVVDLTKAELLAFVRKQAGGDGSIQEGQTSADLLAELPLDELRKEFFRLLSLCIFEETQRHEAELCGRVENDYDQAQEAIFLVRGRCNKFFDQCTLAPHNATDVNDPISLQSAHQCVEALERPLFEQWRRERALARQVALDAPVAGSCVFEQLRIQARVNQWLHEDMAFDRRVDLFSSYQCSFMRYLYTTFGDTFFDQVVKPFVQTENGKQQVDAISVTKFAFAPLFENGHKKAPSSDFWPRLNEQAQPIFDSIYLEEFKGDTSFNNAIASGRWTFKLVTVMMLAWCRLHKHEMPNDDPDIHQPSVRIMSNRFPSSGPVLQGPNMTSLRRLVGTLFNTGFPVFLSPISVELHTQMRMRRGRLRREAFVDTFKGRTIAEIRRVVVATQSFLFRLQEGTL